MLEGLQDTMSKRLEHGNHTHVYTHSLTRISMASHIFSFSLFQTQALLISSIQAPVSTANQRARCTRLSSICWSVSSLCLCSHYTEGQAYCSRLSDQCISHCLLKTKLRNSAYQELPGWKLFVAGLMHHSEELCAVWQHQSLSLL